MKILLLILLIILELSIGITLYEILNAEIKDDE